MTKERAREVIELSLAGGMFFTMSELKQALIIAKDALEKEHVPENEKTGTQKLSLPAGLDKAAEESWADYEYRGDNSRLLYHDCYEDGFKAGASYQYQKDRGEFAKVKAEIWQEGFKVGVERQKQLNEQ